MFKTQEENPDQQFIEEHLQNGQVKNYIKGRTLGKGGFAQCYELVSQQTGKRYAAKVIDKETLSKGKTKQKLQSEILIHKSLRHKNIVKFQHFFQDHQFVYILLQLCSNNTLNQLLKRRKVLTETQVRYYIVQLLHALKYIHQHKVIHRDLKLGNFFLNDRLQLKVGDFGLATTLTHEGQRRKTMCGTPNYIAPQILQSKRGHSYQVDIWSTGVITYALLYGKPPFQTNQVKFTYDKIKNCEYAFPKTNVSESARHFISRMLVLNPTNRATVGELLSDPFIICEEIAKTLPRSTLACPPSKAFLQQLKNQPKMLDSNKKQQQTQINVHSSRTSKQSIKCKLPRDKIQSIHLHSRPDSSHLHTRPDSSNLHSKPRKSQRSQGSLTRTGSNVVLTRKIPTSIVKTETTGTYITFFEEQAKYGMFYRMNSGMMGMRFNDQTCLISNSKFNKFRYAVLQNNAQVEMQMFEGGQEPQQLQKKMKIIHHFAKMLAPKYQSNNEPKNPLNKLKEDLIPSVAYLVCYFTTTHYTLLCLNNGVFQAKFKDQSDLIIDGEQIIYFSKERKKVSVKNNLLSKQQQQVKIKYNHVMALIKKVKKTKATNNTQDKHTTEDRKEKENPPLIQSSSHSKLAKSKDGKQILPKRQFSSTTNLHHPKKPLTQYTSNGSKVDILHRKQKIF